MSTELDQAKAAVDEAIQQIGVLSITAMGRYSALLNALRGFGSLDDARYNFAMENSLLEDAHKQWKLAVHALERVIALDVLVNPETGGHDQSPYIHGDGTPIHPGCACDGSKPFASMPFPDDNPQSPTYFPRPGVVELAHPDNVAYEETIQARERAGDDAAAVRAYYGTAGR